MTLATTIATSRTRMMMAVPGRTDVESYRSVGTIPSERAFGSRPIEAPTGVGASTT